MSKVDENYKGMTNPTAVADKAILDIKNNMLKISVVPFSGPDIMFGFFKFYGKFIYKSHLANCELQKNFPNMFVSIAPSKYSEASQKEGFDLSWTPLGDQAKRKRSENILNDIVTIQKTTRKFLNKIRKKKQELHFDDSASPEMHNRENHTLGKRTKMDDNEIKLEQDGLTKNPKRKKIN